MKIFASKYRVLIFLFAAIAFPLTANSGSPSGREVTRKDLQTIVRTIGFLENPKDDNRIIAIIYNPADPLSEKEARNIERLVNNDAGRLRSRMVTVSGLDRLKGAGFAILTSGLKNYFDRLGDELKKNKILSFSLDKDCVLHSCCAVYIHSEGRVEILVNKETVDIIEARFNPVFMMMVTVI